MANLIGANLIAAKLIGANLIGAYLSRANLRGAYLNGANLSGAQLSGANFDIANVHSTVFADVDLSTVRGLETVQHLGPSSIGIDALFRSKGKIPAVFLRGCGVPEALIEYLPSLHKSMEPIQFYSCFISYSSQDEAFARRLHARLEAEKLRVWFAPEDMRGGRKTREQIDEAIRVYDRLLLILSENSMNSDWVKWEIKKACKKEKDTGRNVLFPIGLAPYKKIESWKCLDLDGGEDLAAKVRDYHIPDFSQWKHEDDFEKAFAELMHELRREDETRPNHRPA